LLLFILTQKLDFALLFFHGFIFQVFLNRYYYIKFKALSKLLVLFFDFRFWFWNSWGWRL